MTLSFTIQSCTEAEMTSTDISFTVNGTVYYVHPSAGPSMSLNDFIRNSCGLRGTKVMCREGGCGCCVVSVKKSDDGEIHAVNSCLVPVLACDGWEVTTTEGLGSRKKGFHPIQERLTQYNGSQCGFCSPGMVMSMYSQLSSNSKSTKQEMEAIFDGNLCRCTGFRSILDASKSLAHNSSSACTDIENLPLCKKTGSPCAQSCEQSEPVGLNVGNGLTWFRPTKLLFLLNLVVKFKANRVRLVVGNTSTGIYKNDGPYDIYIDTSGCVDLFEISDVADNAFTVGANVSLTNLIAVTEKYSAIGGFQYCASIAAHLRQVASLPVRNVASWAGNLVTKVNHPDFPSDVFVLLMAVGAEITVDAGKTAGSTVVTAEQLLSTSLQGKAITMMTLKAMKATNQLITYKIMPRSQNAHALVNAAFLFDYDSKSHVINSCRLVFGALENLKYGYVHAAKTEQFLASKSLAAGTTISGALSVLESELHGCSVFQSQLCASLIYKAFLKLLGQQVPPVLRSGGEQIARPLMSGQQKILTNKAEWPLTEPMTRVTAKMQASGEAQYVHDIPNSPKTLHGAFVLSLVGNARLAGIDASEALKQPGVVRVIVASDIPGINTISPPVCTPNDVPEPVLCESQVEYAGQALAVVVATTEQAASAATKLVKVKYDNVQPPVTDVQQAVAKKMFFDKQHNRIVKGDSNAALKASYKVVEGMTPLKKR